MTSKDEAVKAIVCSRQYVTVREDVHEVVNDLFSREVESGLYLYYKILSKFSYFKCDSHFGPL